MEETKQCSVKSGCGKWKSLDEFTKGRNQCKQCRARIEKERIRKNPNKNTKTAEYYRDYRAKKKLETGVVHTCKEPPKTHISKTYGLSEEDYQMLLKKQNNSCGICGISETEFVSKYKGNRNLTKLFVDHDHVTGEVRGLLCDNCNRGIGMLGDTKEDLVKALNYLS